MFFSIYEENDPPPVDFFRKNAILRNSKRSDFGEKSRFWGQKSRKMVENWVRRGFLKSRFHWWNFFWKGKNFWNNLEFFGEKYVLMGKKLWCEEKFYDWWMKIKKSKIFFWNQEKLLVKKKEKLFKRWFWLKFLKKLEYLLKWLNFLCFCVYEEVFMFFYKIDKNLCFLLIKIKFMEL